MCILVGVPLIGTYLTGCALSWACLSWACISQGMHFHSMGLAGWSISSLQLLNLSRRTVPHPHNKRTRSERKRSLTPQYRVFRHRQQCEAGDNCDLDPKDLSPREELSPPFGPMQRSPRARPRQADRRRPIKSTATSQSADQWTSPWARPRLLAKR
jgi:hypothetical protein